MSAFLVFQAAEHVCALPLTSIQQIIHMAELLAPPASSILLAGFLNLAGSAIPVVRALPWTTSPALPGLYTPIIVVKQHDRSVGILVDSLAEVLEIDPGSLIEASDEYIFNGCVTAVFQSAGGTVHLLSPDRIFLENERNRLETLRFAEQERLDSLGAVN